MPAVMSRSAMGAMRRLGVKVGTRSGAPALWRGAKVTSSVSAVDGWFLGGALTAPKRAASAVAYKAQEAVSYQTMRQPFGVLTILDMIGAHEPPKNFKMLDGGCGVGQHACALASAFPDAKMVGLDLSPDMVAGARACAEAKGLGNVTFQEGDVTKLPFETASFDVVLLSQVLHHLPEPVRDSYTLALEEAKRILRPGGLLLVTATRWTQRRHSYWTFKLMPESTWEKLADNDRWTCFERTLSNDKTLTQVIAGMGFKQDNMIIPRDSHWTSDARYNVDAALTPEWRATEGCFAYMSEREQSDFVREVERLVASPAEKEKLISEVESRRDIYGEGTVYAFTRQSEKQIAAIEKETATYLAGKPKRTDGHMGWVNLVSGSREPMKIERLSPYVGAVAKNVDMTDPECCEAVKQAMWEYGTVIIPASEMAFKPNAHLELSRLWGPVEEYHPINPQHPEEPLVQMLPTCGMGVAGPDSFLWHNDMSWRPVPSAGGQLCGMVIPPYGGETKVCNTNAVWESLDKDLQDILMQMTGHHDLEVGYSRVNRPKTYETNPEGYKRDSDKLGGEYSADHPAIISHYATGRPHIFINPNFTVSISGGGLSEKECQEVFDRVSKAMDHPDYQVAIRWQEVEPGTVACWDNWGVMHIAPADYMPHYRMMHRTVTLGPGQPQRYTGKSADSGVGKFVPGGRETTGLPRQSAQ